MYGKPRTSDSYVTRLMTELNSGDTQFTVATGLDWQANEEISVLTNTKAAD